MTSVPSAPTTTSSAWITATAPPKTQPSADSDEWTSRTPPGRTPTARRSRARLSDVRGTSVAAIRSASRMRTRLTGAGGHDRGADGRRDLRPEELDRAHDPLVRHRPDAELDEEPLVV